MKEDGKYIFQIGPVTFSFNSRNLNLVTYTTDQEMI